MSEHTPGPCPSDEAIIKSALAYLHSSSAWAGTNDFAPGIEEAWERVKALLTAAPDLLAALRGLVRLLEQGATGEWLCQVAEEYPEKSILVRAQAAIAKAEANANT